MIFPRITCVVPDATGPLAVPTTPLIWTFGVDVVIPVRVVHASGVAYDLSGPVAGVLGFKHEDDDDEPFFQREWVITNPILGDAEFHISREDRGELVTGPLVASIRFRDNVTDFEDDILGPSRTEITSQVASLDSPVTALPADQPLAQGPPGTIRTRTVGKTNVATMIGPQTINGVALVPDDVVLLAGQTDETENGVWLVKAGAWTRPVTFSAGSHAAGTLVVVEQGLVDADTIWICTTDSPADVIDTDALTFEDVVNKDSLSASEHRAIRQLIHFVDDGPAAGFASGAYRETLPLGDPFPTSETWWTSAAKTQKIVDLTIVRDVEQKPTSETWKAYDIDGVTVIESVIDVIAYSGPFETSRTRTI